MYFKDIEDILLREYDNFSDLSVELIKYFMSVLSIDTKIVYSSELCKDTNLTGLDKIFYILEK